MVKILFLIHDLGQGGAEKVLVNLVNNMDPEQFDISVTALFGGGVNEQFLAPHIRFRAVFPKAFPGNSRLMKLLTPTQLHRLCVKERYDIEVSYLEGPSARVISGCREPGTKTLCWIHSTFSSRREAAGSFRSHAEAEACYRRFDRVICVSQGILRGFQKIFPAVQTCAVYYNTVESDRILALAAEPAPDGLFPADAVNLIAVGSLKPVKGFDRLIRVHARLRKDGFPVRTCILGKGPDLDALRGLCAGLGVSNSVIFPGYDTNPYRYVAKADLFVCSSHSEGFSTAATEALIVGTPVCTVEVSGMKEMLGEHNEWGVVTENSEDALYEGIRLLVQSPELLAHYREKAALRGKAFNTETTVKAVETLFSTL